MNNTFFKFLVLIFLNFTFVNSYKINLLNTFECTSQNRLIYFVFNCCYFISNECLNGFR